ncbi:chloride channel [Dunaliella salina]|uniref:Chloride channel n=1 Tax=Dunaliella salina TaxID=3046 RepID=A0ABQ7GDV4_DUNSA|nr:chloride channel [Dunaliella salina]|eukprot:KAF5832786.1 chloride channel [Dunaliella salina]
MLWHAAIAAGIALYVTLVWMGVDVDPGNLWAAHFGNPLDFVVKGGIVNTVAIYYYAPWELLIFMLMGLVGGLMGAFLVPMNELLFRVRRKFVPRTRPFRRMMEVVFYAVIATTIWFFISYASPCADNPVFDQTPDTPAEAHGIQAKNGHFKARSSGNMYEQLWCLDEGQHSEYGVLFFTPLANALARVYANPALQGSPDDDGQDRKISTEEILYSATALGCLFVLTYLLMNATYGIGAAAGIFVPTLLSGAAGGRLVGRIVRASLISRGAHPGQYKVSLAAYAVIVADFMTIGIYNTNMERHAYPFLPEQPEGLEALKLSHQLQVADVMTPKIVAMPVVIRIREMVAFLKTHPFNTIPLVTPDRRALQEALAAQHKQQTKAQERILQNLVNQHMENDHKGLSDLEGGDRYTCPAKLPTHKDRPCDGKQKKDAPLSQPQQATGTDNRIMPDTGTKRISSESDKPGGFGAQGRVVGLWGPHSPQQQRRQQQKSVPKSVAPGPGSLPSEHVSSSSVFARSGAQPPMLGSSLLPHGHSPGPPNRPSSPGVPLGEGRVWEGDWDAARLGGQAAHVQEREDERITAGEVGDGVEGRAVENERGGVRAGSGVTEGRVREGEWDHARLGSGGERQGRRKRVSFEEGQGCAGSAAGADAAEDGSGRNGAWVGAAAHGSGITLA